MSATETIQDSKLSVQEIGAMTFCIRYFLYFLYYTALSFTFKYMYFKKFLGGSVLDNAA